MFAKRSNLFLVFSNGKHRFGVYNESIMDFIGSKFVFFQLTLNVASKKQSDEKFFAFLSSSGSLIDAALPI